MIDLFVEHNMLVFIALVLVAGFSLWGWELFKMDKLVRLKKIKKAAYLLVSQAEFSFGSQMGKQKFEFVYKGLQTKFKIIRYLPATLVYNIIENALDDLKEVLEEENGNVEL